MAVAVKSEKRRLLAELPVGCGMAGRFASTGSGRMWNRGLYKVRMQHLGFSGMLYVLMIKC